MNNSSSSSEITRTATPRSRRSISAWRISIEAPTSTPQVGWATTMIFGSSMVSRPTMNFCRLPPDRLDAAACSSRALTLNRLITSRAKPRTTLCLINPCSTMPPLSILQWLPVSSAFSARLSAGTAPRPRRSSGTKPSPMERRSAGSRWPAAVLPSMIDSGFPHGISPDRAASNSFWPLPDTPAMPTISPLRTARLIERRVMPKGSRVFRVSRSMRSSASPGSRASRRHSGRSEPIIIFARLAAVSCFGLAVPVTRPPRNTVALSHKDWISSSLWLIYKMEQPSAASRRNVSNSFSTACGVSTEVGSSMISSFGFCSRQRTISTRWRSPTDMLCTSRCGSIGRP